MSAAVASAVLVAYLLVSEQVYLPTPVLGASVCLSGVGPTELRILLALANLAVFAWPRVTVGGFEVRLFDAVGALGGLALACALVVTVARTTVELYRLERL